MIKLSDRLQVIANLIDKGQTMADIGTDHGFLPLYLFERDISPKVILADISKGSLQKAIDNVEDKACEEENTDSAFQFRLGNGIEVLEDGEVDIVVIAGMGGALMTQILGTNLEKSKSFKKIILQPRNAPGKLRFWLQHNGFEIVSENLVREGKFICEILEIQPSGNEPGQDQVQNGQEDDIKYEVPVSLLIRNGDLAIEFVQRKLNTEINILENMGKAVEIDQEKVEKTKQRIDYLQKLLNNEVR
ncbi:tRNA (adenine(22)-N(1))-methyltransferase [Clostridium aminobutyricum]|uniref:SAM-dependent methyltransferase n=1 Tax=Clostridium aminobutyricum TaxID=33953 RepID=A0A939IIE4_CLOAM|nr:class I SAM-dependent methyltransferase [Clostridium aminobutyricum]MBN7772409.1 SAM-dependent methyltransferase [Clostridium aminobutyricum]